MFIGVLYIVLAVVTAATGFVEALHEDFLWRVIAAIALLAANEAHPWDSEMKPRILRITVVAIILAFLASSIGTMSVIGRVLVALTLAFLGIGMIYLRRR